MPSQQMDFSCPQCHQIDQVQKVSAVVNAGSLGSKFTFEIPGKIPGSTFQGHAKGATQTTLSERLAPPAMPRLNESHHGKAILLFITVIGILVGQLVIKAPLMSNTESASGQGFGT